MNHKLSFIYFKWHSINNNNICNQQWHIRKIKDKINFVILMMETLTNRFKNLNFFFMCMKLETGNWKIEM